jgi:hypothetical protein
MRLILVAWPVLRFVTARSEPTILTTMIDVNRGPQVDTPLPQSHTLALNCTDRTSCSEWHHRTASGFAMCLDHRPAPPSWLAVKPQGAEAITGGGTRMT